MLQVTQGTKQGPDMADQKARGKAVNLAASEI